MLKKEKAEEIFRPALFSRSQRDYLIDIILNSVLRFC